MKTSLILVKNYGASGLPKMMVLVGSPSHSISGGVLCKQFRLNQAIDEAASAFDAVRVRDEPVFGKITNIGFLDDL